MESWIGGFDKNCPSCVQIHRTWKRVQVSKKRGQPFAHVHIAVRVALINGHARMLYILADVQAMMPIKLGIRGKAARAYLSH